MEKVRVRGVMVGAAEEIVDQLNDLRDRAGVPIDFACRSFFSSMPHTQQVELMERLAAEVMPHV